MPLIVLDPEIAREYREWFDRFTESWDGVDVVAPLANNEHQELQLAFCIPMFEVIVATSLGQVFPGVNVADRHTGWRQNYRGPDVAVYLNSNPAVNNDTHWVGGPDFLVEIISEGEDPHAKFAFYATVNTREVLVVERNPWALELFNLANGTLVSVGRSDVENGLVLTSDALGLTFKLVAGSPRPKVEVKHPESGKRWVV